MKLEAVGNSEEKLNRSRWRGGANAVLRAAAISTFLVMVVGCGESLSGETTTEAAAEAEPKAATTPSDSEAALDDATYQSLLHDEPDLEMRTTPATNDLSLKDRSYPVPQPDQYLAGRHAPRVDGAASATEHEPFTPEWAEAQEFIVAPWVHVLDREVAESAAVHPDRLVFPSRFEELLSSYELLDVLVSPSREQSFLRRIVDMRRDGDRIVVETRNARLTEAILQGHIMSSRHPSHVPGPIREPGPLAEPSGELQTTRHALGEATVRNPDTMTYSDIGKWGIDDLGLGNVDMRTPWGLWNSFGGGAAVRMSGRLNASLHPRYWFNLDIDFSAGDRGPNNSLGIFYSTRSCETHDDCFNGGESGGERCLTYVPDAAPVHAALAEVLEPGENYCGYRPDYEDVEVRLDDGSTVTRTEYASCDRLLRTLDWVKSGGDGEQCGADWETWYSSRGREGARNPESCRGWTWDAMAPYPAQIEWTKMVCGGALNALELDFRTDMSAGVENFEMRIEGNGFRVWETIEPKTAPIFTPFFFVGPVPVLFTVNTEFHLPIFFYVTAALNMNLDHPSFIGVRDIKNMGSGVHLYGSREAYENGHFGPDQFPGYEYLGKLHGNERIHKEETEFHTPTVGGNFDGALIFMIMPEINTMLYDMVGPFVRPFSQTNTVTGAFGTERTCNLTFKVGFRVDVGLHGRLPFGMASKQRSNVGSSNRIRKLLEGEPQLIWELYNSCSHLSPFLTFDFNDPEKNLPTEEGGHTGPTDPGCNDRRYCYELCLVGSCPESGGHGKGDEIAGAGDGDEQPNTGANGGGCSTAGEHGAPMGPWLLLVGMIGLGLRRRTASGSTQDPS